MAAPVSMSGEPLDVAALGWHGLGATGARPCVGLTITAVGRRHGSRVEMTHLDRGIFDEGSVSVITSATVGEIGRLATQPPDVRRFRPNILAASLRSVLFEEDDWVGGIASALARHAPPPTF